MSIMADCHRPEPVLPTSQPFVPDRLINGEHDFSSLSSPDFYDDFNFITTVYIAFALMISPVTRHFPDKVTVHGYLS